MSIKITASTIDEIAMMDHIIRSGILNITDRKLLSITDKLDVSFSVSGYDDLKVKAVHYADGEIIGIIYDDGTELLSKKYYRVMEEIDILNEIKELLYKLNDNYLDSKSYSRLRYLYRKLLKLSDKSYYGIKSSIDNIQNKLNKYKYDNYMKYSLPPSVKLLITKLRELRDYASELDYSNNSTLLQEIESKESIILSTLKQLKIDPVYYISTDQSNI